MRLICFWCFLMAATVRAQDDGYYTPQTFRQGAAHQQRRLFSPSRNDVIPEGTSVSEPWRANDNGAWRESSSGSGNTIIPKSEPWRLPYGLSKEQQAAIIHHKQSLTSEGAFRFEYASDNGLSAGEQIEPDGTRVGAYQYKDPNGQLVKLKYRAGKEGFQILEGSHLPKSPEPVAPVSTDNYYKQAYEQQRQQYSLQQQYNQQKHEPQQQSWGQNQSPEGQKPAGNQYFINNWKSQNSLADDGQYHSNDVDPNKPHNFGAGYAFAFQG